MNKKKIIHLIIAIVFIVVNGILAIKEVYPLWIGYFNYLMAFSPIIWFIK